MILSASDLAVRYPGNAVDAITGVDFGLAEGELVALVGPNGCGKTTLLRALLGLLHPRLGRIVLDDRPIGSWSRGELARRIALVPQREETPFSWRVEEMVGFGRYVWRGPLSAMNAADRDAIERALARCDLLPFRARRVETLSGGEWQRVRVARALAQEAGILFLDEPTASLDLGHEMELFELVRRLVAEGLSALVVTHHLNLAARFADRMGLITEGSLVASGPPEEVLQAGLISEVFRWPVTVGQSPEGRPQIVPLRDYS